MTPTASREDLQRDAHYQATRHALSETLIDGLGRVAREQPDAWRRVLARHNEALLGAALCDERLFDLLKDSLRIPTSQGDVPAADLLNRGAVHVVLDNQHGFEGMLFRALGIPVAHGNRYAVGPFLRRWTQSHGVRLVELGTAQGNRQLFHAAPLPEAELQWLQQHLGDGEQLVTARFSPQDLPLVVVPDRDAELKRRLDEDASDKQMSQAALRLARQFTAKMDDGPERRLYVNLDNAAIAALLQAMRDDNPHADDAATLLKAFKTILGGHGQGADGGPALNRALQQLATTVQRLIAPSPPTHQDASA